MQESPAPAREEERLTAVRRYRILDTPPDAAFDRLTALAAHVFRVPHTGISFTDRDRVWFKSLHGLPLSDLPRAATFCDWVNQSAQTFAVPDAARDPRFHDLGIVTGPPHVRFYAGAPLLTPEGLALGTLFLAGPQPRELDAEGQALLADLAALVMREVELHRAAQEAGRDDRDPLTGLLNHRAFHKRLREELLRARPCALLLLDLDGFRLFNDVYGHAAGDDVLRRVAAAVQETAAARGALAAARFGGDEFAVLLPAPLPAAAAFEAALSAHLARAEYRPPGHDSAIPLALSAGAAAAPEDGPTRQGLLGAAGARLLRAKTGGGLAAPAAHLRRALSGSVQGFSMLDALVTAVDNKDRYTRRHSEDVMRYGLQVAGALGLGEAERRTVAVAALLHDVGKIGVPDHVLRKPGGLTEAEMGAVRQHPMMGAIMVGAVPGLEGTLDAVRHHHERWDGGGYPFGLRGEECPLLARLMAVADAYSAMTTDRPYRRGMGRGRALAILEGGAGAQWDPRCVAAFLSAQRDGPG